MEIPLAHPYDDDAVVATLTSHEYDLESGGLPFLLKESGGNDFFLLGELHGDNEIPALLRKLWPGMWRQGYRHIAAEVSPWAAQQLECGSAEKSSSLSWLWTKQEAHDVRLYAQPGDGVLWGCDMEESQPQLVISELARLNSGDSSLRHMTELTKDGYDRKRAPDLLAILKESRGQADRTVNGISLRENLIKTLEIESDRLHEETKLAAQNRRERLMKEQFLQHYRLASKSGAVVKVFFRFGRNHLHRGYDTRGISTLGNFIAEFGLSHGKKTFNIGAFGAGGKAALAGNTWDADERQDEPAFAALAEQAKYNTTLFDLRPLRAVLHGIPAEKRSETQRNLAYWADSYDALICYKTVTPRER